MNAEGCPVSMHSPVHDESCGPKPLSNSLKSLWQAVPQEHALGCAVACVASRTGLGYDQALALFSEPDHAWQRGYYCPEIIDALARAGLQYAFSAYDPARHSLYLARAGTMVFIAPGSRFPMGHFVLLTPAGWMNPWSNYPRLLPLEASFERELPGPVSYVLYELNDQTSARQSPRS